MRCNRTKVNHRKSIKEPAAVSVSAISKYAMVEWMNEIYTMTSIDNDLHCKCIGFSIQFNWIAFAVAQFCWLHRGSTYVEIPGSGWTIMAQSMEHNTYHNGWLELSLCCRSSSIFQFIFASQLFRRSAKQQYNGNVASPTTGFSVYRMFHCTLGTCRPNTHRHSHTHTHFCNAKRTLRMFRCTRHT